MPLPYFLMAVLVAFPPATQQAPAGEKERRTPAQQKINSQLLYEIYRLRGEAERNAVPPGPTGVKIDTRGRALVDVRADPTPALQNHIRRSGGLVLSTSARGRSIIARIPLLKLEALAADPAVLFIEPSAEAITGRYLP
jgi:hypothetical protein